MGDHSPVYHLGIILTSHPGLLSLAIPLWVGAVSTWRRSRVGRTLFSAGELSLSYARLLAGRMITHFVGQTSAIGQPTWPTQPSIPQRSVNE